jgi:hypothetical protein
MDFGGITKLLNQTFQEKGKMPVEILVNGGWLERQIQGRFILRKEGENPIEAFTGIPTHMDDKVDTFKFVYSEE